MIKLSIFHQKYGHMKMSTGERTDIYRHSGFIISFAFLPKIWVIVGVWFWEEKKNYLFIRLAVLRSISLCETVWEIPKVWSQFCWQVAQVAQVAQVIQDIDIRK